MSKSVKIISSVVAASALWLGGTAYLSSNTQKHLERYVNQVNKVYEANGMKMSLEQFNKGFFSSEAKMSIDFTNPELKKMLTQSIKLPIETEYEIENGPLFFKNGLGVGLSRMSNHVNLNDYFLESSEIQKVLKNDIILDSITTVGFTKNATFDASTTEIELDVEGEKLKISPLQFGGHMNIESFVGEITMQSDSMLIGDKEEFFRANDIYMEMKITEFFENGFYLGDMSLKAEDISTKGLDLPFEFEKAKMDIEMKMSKNSDETVNIDMMIKGNSGSSKLPDDYAFLKQGEINYALHGMKLEGLLAFQDFTKKIQAKQADIMSRLISSETGEIDMAVYGELEAMQEETLSGMIALVPSILKKDSSAFTFAVDLEDKASKKSTLAMNLGYIGEKELPRDAKELEAFFKKELRNLFTLDAKIELEKDYIANLPMELQQALAGQLQMGTMMGIVKENNSSYSFSAELKPNKLMVNGEDRSAMLEMLEQGMAIGQ